MERVVVRELGRVEKLDHRHLQKKEAWRGQGTSRPTGGRVGVEEARRSPLLRIEEDNDPLLIFSLLIKMGFGHPACVLISCTNYAPFYVTAVDVASCSTLDHFVRAWQALTPRILYGRVTFRDQYGRLELPRPDLARSLIMPYPLI